MHLPSLFRIHQQNIDSMFHLLTKDFQSTQSQMQTFMRDMQSGFYSKCQGTKEYTVQLDLAGCSKENIQIILPTQKEDIKNRSILINWKRQTKCKQETGSHSFSVGEDINIDQISAKVADGVLTITLPKKQISPKIQAKKPQIKRLEIK